MVFTKTDFLQYLQCRKNLWLKKKKPELYVEEQLSEFEESKIEEGHEVELLARGLFERGTLLADDLQESLNETKELIVKNVSPLFQASVQSPSGCLARVDIMCFDEASGKWDIYEVKSATEVKTDRRHNHLKDVSFQKLVLEESRITVNRAFIVHLNKDYRRAGELNLRELFIFHDVTDDLRAAALNTANEIKEALEFLNHDEIDTRYCDCLYLSRGNHCSSFRVLNPNVPDYSVHDILRIRADKIKVLVDAGVSAIVDVSSSFKLTDIQRDQVDVAQSGEVRINFAAIRRILEGFSYPLYFVDYETYSAAIPIIDGFAPYQHLPFQVSIHKLDEEGKLQHLEFLSTNINDVPKDVVEFLCRAVSPKGTLVSWHASFESSKNKELAEMFPDRAGVLLDLNARTFDLEVVFKSFYLHPGFMGRSSIKKVLPVLVPDLSYDVLDIHGGTQAMETWRKLMFSETTPAQHEAGRQALLEYCRMDTLAMVKIFNHLKSVVT